MNIRNLPWVTFSLLIVCVGCRTPVEKPHTKRDPSTDFAAYRTFALLPPEIKRDVDRDTAGKVIVAAERGARDALRNQGYSEVSPESADLVFYMHGKALAPVAVSNMGYQPTPEMFGVTPKQVSATSYSHLFVEGYDNHTKRQVWMDWVECNCTHVVPSRVENEIHHILEGFPARVQSLSRAQ
jgi:hypothetical protein